MRPGLSTRTYSASRSATGGRLSGRGRLATTDRRRRKIRVPLIYRSWRKNPRTGIYGFSSAAPRFTLKSKTTINTAPIEASLGGGSTKTTYTQGRKKMPRRVYNLFASNQDWVNTATGTYKLKNDAYGTQSVNYHNIYNNAFFTADANLCAGATLTSDQLNTTEIFYGTFHVITTFTNAEVTTSYLKIFEVSPRFHLTVESTYGPAVMWRSGLDASYGSSIPNAHTKVYNSPFDSPYFTHLYRVKKIYNIAIGPGASHEHHATYHINRGLYGFLMYPFEINRTLSNMQMYVVAGSPINDSATPTLVSTSTVSLDVVTRTTRNFTYAPQSRTRYNYTDSLATITAANVITDVAKISDTNA